MKIFAALLHTRFASLFASLFAAKTRNGQQSGKKTPAWRIILYVLLMAYVASVFFGMFIGLFLSIAAVLAGTEMIWVYFTLAFSVAFTIIFVGSVFMTKSQLFEAKDNELLLSMPVPPRFILLSRMAALIVFNYILEAPVILPALIIGLISGLFTPLSFVLFLLVGLLTPFLGVAVSSLFGWLLALIAARIKHKSFTTVLFSVIFLCAYLWGYSNLMNGVENIESKITDIVSGLEKVIPLYWIGKACSAPDAVSALAALAILILPFLLVFAVLSRNFSKTLAIKKGFSKEKYVETKAKMQSRLATLLQREYRRLGASPNYIINAGVGEIMLMIAAVALMVYKPQITTAGLELDGIMPALLLSGMFFLVGMIAYIAPSVSLEGKTLWILRSSPIPAKDILLSKLLMHDLTALPGVLLGAVAVCYTGAPGFLGGLLIFVCLLLFLGLMGNLGLAVAVKHVNLEWTNEIQVIKQGMSMFLYMMEGMGLTMVFGGICVPITLFLGLVPALLICALFLGLGVYLTSRWIFRRGVHIWDTL